MTVFHSLSLVTLSIFLRRHALPLWLPMPPVGSWLGAIETEILATRRKTEGAVVPPAKTT